jgi:hypothetical protein
MSATLNVIHEVGFGFELRRGRFDVVVDDTTVGSVDNHESIETPLEPGHRTIQIRHGRYSSRDEAVEVVDGDVVNFRCHGVRIWPMYVASIFVPNLAITLQRD